MRAYRPKKPVSIYLQGEEVDFTIHHIRRAKGLLVGDMKLVAEAEEQIKFANQKHNDPVAREARDSPGIIIDG